jgi:hypothetical protein
MRGCGCICHFPSLVTAKLFSFSAKISLDLRRVPYVNPIPPISLKQYYVLINGSEPGGRPFTPAGFLRLCRIRNLQKIQTRRGKERKTT